MNTDLNAFSKKDIWLNAAAFLSVLLIWSTTPLFIQLSSASAPFTSISVRMLIGFAFCLVMVLLSQRGLASTFKTTSTGWKLYIVGGVATYFAMICFYLAAQEIPSGWIAVLFGLSPIVTGFFASFVEPEAKLNLRRLFGLFLGVGGLYLVFSAGLSFEQASIVGVLYALGATVVSSLSAVISRQLIKTQNMNGMQITTGSLLIALPLFIVTKFVFEPGLHNPFTNIELMGITYLGLVGTGIGFTLYYFLLKRISASRISLVTLVTPISALSLGAWLNHEPLLTEVWLGAGLVCTGLALYEFKPKLGLRRM